MERERERERERQRERERDRERDRESIYNYVITLLTGVQVRISKVEFINLITSSITPGGRFIDSLGVQS